MGFFSSSSSKAPALERPVLDLSGPALTAATERLAAACEETGGVEAYVEALRLKGEAFRKIFAEAGPGGPSAEEFTVLAGLMPTVRRRIGDWLEGDKFATLRKAVMELVGAKHDELLVDQRIAEFCVQFPQGKRYRWVKDLAGELLHALDPERYPLMCRWVWDTGSNTGVLREIWHGDVDRVSIRVSDGYATHVMLREELSQFLAGNGVFRDTLLYVDLLMAQVYSEYIAAQGGSYLRADFTAAEDAVAYLRRLLGLDGVRIKHNDRAVAQAARAALPGL
ncbi:MAG: hypothetical protein IE933_01110 [Sphingomonadales bacterium]|nr:hypothetical protein [Sphingomonadales bacterium]MBD3772677.1 hypothetical protein [Paracoccaceae bacterium]